MLAKGYDYMLRAFCGVVCMLASPALAQTPAAQEQKPSMEELLRRMDALQRRAAEGDELISALRHRVEELEVHERHAKTRATAAHHETTAPTAGRGSRSSMGSTPTRRPPAPCARATGSERPSAHPRSTTRGPAGQRRNGAPRHLRAHHGLPRTVRPSSPGRVTADPEMGGRQMPGPAARSRPPTSLRSRPRRRRPLKPRPPAPPTDLHGSPD